MIRLHWTPVKLVGTYSWHVQYFISFKPNNKKRKYKKSQNCAPLLIFFPVLVGKI